jgi:hypothetical protein
MKKELMILSSITFGSSCHLTMYNLLIKVTIFCANYMILLHKIFLFYLKEKVILSKTQRTEINLNNIIH